MGDDAPDPVALIVDAQDAYRDAAAAGRPAPLGIGTQAVDAAVQGDKHSGSIHHTDCTHIQAAHRVLFQRFLVGVLARLDRKSVG